MDNIYHNLTSFLAIWFRNLQKSTYNVNVINKEADKVSPLLYEKLQAIHFLLQDLGGRELKVKVSNQKELNTKDIEDKLSALLGSVNSIELDNSTVEKLLSDLISLSKGVKKVEVLNQPEMPSKMSVVGKVEVSNLPKIQEVTGDFNLKESKDILNSLKELASEIRDLKLESIQGYKSIGKLLAPDTDVTAHTNYARKYYTSAGAATDGIIWSPAAGKRWHVVTMYIQVSAAATVTLEDDKAAGDDPVWKAELAANSGAVLSFTEQYPMASGEDAADLLVTTTAGNVYITAVGYEV